MSWRVSLTCNFYLHTDMTEDVAQEIRFLQIRTKFPIGDGMIVKGSIAFVYLLSLINQWLQLLSGDLISSQSFTTNKNTSNFWSFLYTIRSRLLVLISPSRFWSSGRIPYFNAFYFSIFEDTFICCVCFLFTKSSRSLRQFPSWLP